MTPSFVFMVGFAVGFLAGLLLAVTLKFLFK